MAWRLDRIFWGLVRPLIHLRYRVTTDGMEAVRRLHGPTLVLPNHPAYVDPPTVLSHVPLPAALRPLVFSGTYRLLPLLPLMKLVRAFEVPDLSAQSRDAATRTKGLIDAVAARLQAGESFLIYPSGRLQRGDREIVGSARFVHELLTRCPDVNVVLIRTRGLWGSTFSCARRGSLPDLGRAAVSAAGWLLASLVFFLPRRPVHLHAEVVPRDRLPLGSREAFNAFLESWYDADGGQKPIFVRFNAFFGPSQGHFEAAASGDAIDPATISPKTIRLVNELLAAHLKRELSPDELRPDTRFDAIGLDSLDRMELALTIENQFGFRSDTVVDTLGGLWALADGRLAAGAGAQKPAVAPPAWSQTSRSADRTVLAETVAEAFVRRALAEPDAVAVADAMSGVLSHRRLLVAATLMARRFADYPEPHLGVMLPASAAADVVFYAIHLAGKVPVMMNWTTGPANLAHGIAVTETRRILTSRKLVDRLGITVAGADYVFLEEIKRGIGRFEALRVLLATRLMPSRFLRRLPAQRPDDPAVYLFTSGSESAPKTVPLTHDNLLTNVAAGLEVLKPDAADSLLGFLPPFHSFGLTGNVLMPVVAGIRSVRHADPTDARGLVRLIEAYRPTMLFTTPTFLGYILAACSGDELRSLKKIITGAERCPDATFEACRRLAPEAVILEGYGITECSPVVAANRLDKVKSGSIGKPVRHVEAVVVDPDTHEPVPHGTTGMLLVRGRSIFPGYLNHDGASPFVEAAGGRWYRTGDLVSADADGYLTFRGRLKRFLKAGGEMISLPALEEPFQKRYPPDEDGPKVAVEGIETPDGRHVVLFTTFDLPLRDASQILLADGLRGVMRLDEVQRLERIPVLGTGKTDYTALRRLVTESVASP
jgi:acyl-CoA synthetase (AMP-forming)/AMP-acid ligase II/1-acyl-sn-glycerol-3-phosphate acyltransferase/acyl carrier protein